MKGSQRTLSCDVFDSLAVRAVSSMDCACIWERVAVDCSNLTLRRRVSDAMLPVEAMPLPCSGQISPGEWDS